MKKLRLIKVPVESRNHFINYVGCLRYEDKDGKMSSVIEPAQIGFYLEPTKHKIAGYVELNDDKFIVIDNVD